MHPSFLCCGQRIFRKQNTFPHIILVWYRLNCYSSVKNEETAIFLSLNSMLLHVQLVAFQRLASCSTLTLTTYRWNLIGYWVKLDHKDGKSIIIWRVLPKTEPNKEDGDPVIRTNWRFKIVAEKFLISNKKLLSWQIRNEQKHSSLMIRPKKNLL